jgi:hypothetical protein
MIILQLVVDINILPMKNVNKVKELLVDVAIDNKTSNIVMLVQVMLKTVDYLVILVVDNNVAINNNNNKLLLNQLVKLVELLLVVKLLNQMHTFNHMVRVVYSNLVVVVIEENKHLSRINYLNINSLYLLVLELFILLVAEDKLLVLH